MSVCACDRARVCVRVSRYGFACVKGCACMLVCVCAQATSRGREGSRGRRRSVEMKPSVIASRFDSRERDRDTEIQGEFVKSDAPELGFQGVARKQI